MSAAGKARQKRFKQQRERTTPNLGPAFQPISALTRGDGPPVAHPEVDGVRVLSERLRGPGHFGHVPRQGGELVAEVRVLLLDVADVAGLVLECICKIKTYGERQEQCYGLS